MKMAMNLLRCLLAAVPLAAAAPQRDPSVPACVVEGATSSSSNVTHDEHTRIAEGFATLYGDASEGMTTASGAPFDPDAFVAAHPTFPFGTVLWVTNLENGRSVRVCVIDRGPAEGPQSEGVIIDLSRRAFQEIAALAEGRVRVQVKVL